MPSKKPKHRDFYQRPELLDRDEDYIDMVTNLTEAEAIRRSPFKQSAFKKPYREKSYEPMERYYTNPLPKWDTTRVPRLDPWLDPSVPMIGIPGLPSPEPTWCNCDTWNAVCAGIPKAERKGWCKKCAPSCECNLWKEKCRHIAPDERTGFCKDSEQTCTPGGGVWCAELEIIVQGGEIDETTTESTKPFKIVDNDGNDVTNLVEWSVEGTGVIISEDGILTTDDSACGTIVITAEDPCGNTASQRVRVTDQGHWGTPTLCYGFCHHDGQANCITGTYWYIYNYCCTSGTTITCGNPCNYGCSGEETLYSTFMSTYPWVC